MKFFDVFINYIRFTLKQGSTSFLVMVYPIFLILIIGTGLSITNPNKINVAVLGSDEIFNILARDNSINIIKADNVDNLEWLVRSKKAIMGIAIEKEGDRKVINVFMDSTKKAVLSNLLLLIDKAVNEEKIKSANDLSSIQKKLAPKLIEIKNKYQQMDTVITEITEIQEKAASIGSELDQSKTELSNYNEELLSYKSGLGSIDDYNQKLSDYELRLSDILNDVSNAEAERNNLVLKINDRIYKISGYITKTNTALSYVRNAKLYTTVPIVVSNLNKIENEITSVKSDLIEAQNDLIDINNDLSRIDFYPIKNDISNTKNEISTTNYQLRSFKTEANTKIDSMLLKVAQLDNKISISINELKEFEEKLSFTKAETFRAKDLVSEIIRPLDDFIGKKPEELLPPEINSFSVFKDEKTINMFFPSIIGIDMLLASLLLPMIMKVRMKEQGVELRMLRSKASSISIILGEFLANYVMGLFQLFVIILFGVVLFEVRFASFLGFLGVFFTIPLVFVSLGLMLSQIINRSSTAFLLSLLISIPMIFVSGTIIPIEFLNPLVAFFGSLTPLYISINFSEKLIFRNTGLLQALVDYGYIIFFTLINLTIATIIYRLKK
ncbi:ABC transporter permease [Candidatus Micrarchaeota archaeon]|nr:ABC transporter permease [Candidatus Micrarchaeota archaeon]